MIHVAVMQLNEAFEGETEQVFTSLDGEKYLPVTRRPETGDEAQIVKLFQPDEEGFRHITYARRAMDHWWWGDQAKSFEHYTI